jgi:hypothetical protein
MAKPLCGGPLGPHGKNREHEGELRWISYAGPCPGRTLLRACEACLNEAGIEPAGGLDKHTPIEVDWPAPRWRQQRIHKTISPQDARVLKALTEDDDTPLELLADALGIAWVDFRGSMRRLFLRIPVANEMRVVTDADTSSASVTPRATEAPPSKLLWKALTVLESDYSSYGGRVERWSDLKHHSDEDCSCGCRWAHFLESSGDWLVCSNPDGPRFGMLTWEHQAGRGCFEWACDECGEDAIGCRCDDEEGG